jgi:opacity protein-like surface antigen
MKKLLIAAVMMVMVCGIAAAQDFPKWEAFAGFSMLKPDLAGQSSANILDYLLMGPNIYSFSKAMNYAGGNFANGFDVSVTRNLNSWLGVKGSFSSHFKSINVDGLESRSYSGMTEPDTTRWTGNMDYRRYTAVFGPEFSYRKNSRVRPFAHALFGFSKMTADNINIRRIEHSEGNPDYVYAITGKMEGKSGFAMAFGGGLDIKAGKHASIRLVQLDYLPAYNKAALDITNADITDNNSQSVTTSVNTKPSNNMKLSFGVVFNFK